MIVLDRNADTFPAGLAGTPFEDVYRALRIVAAAVWDVDPLAYRAGMAWGWYALNDPSALAGFRDVVTAALISEIAPMVRDTQTDAELVEYLRQWRSYTPTFPKLQSLYALFGAVVDVQPISDPESQSVLPVDDTRLAFYIRIESVDFSRPLSLSDAREIAVRATPLGSRPYPYYALETHIPCAVLPAPVGIYIRVENWEIARVPTPPTPPLPTVIVSDRWLVIGWNVSGNVTIAANGTHDTKVYNDSSELVPSVYDSSLVYAIIRAAKVPYSIVTRTGLQCEDVNGTIGVRNVTSSSISVYQAEYAFCSSNLATVVTVYDSSNNAYNAFKFTASGADYYYVLDGTQADWTDDLASIGYHLPVQYIDMFFYIAQDGNGHAFGNNDYWASLVIDSTDKATLQAFGVTVSTIDRKDVIGRNQQNVTFSFVPIGLYSGVRTGELQADMSNFYCQDGGNNPDSIYYGLCIKNYTAFSTPVATWKCRITKL